MSGTEFMEDIVKSWEDDLKADRKENFMREAPQKLQELRGCLMNMHSTNSFISMTINRCLDYTKTTNGFKLVPKFETVELAALLQKPVQLIHDTHSHSNIEIKIAPLAQDICSHVITDKQWLLENLLCLLSNAAKYSQKGCVDVSVDLVPNACLSEKKSSDMGDTSLNDKDYTTIQCLQFQVQDTGIGLADESMPSLFNPFKQAQRLAGGTGLWLFSLAKRVEALKGQYGVARRPDGEQGSLFWFTIPYRPDDISAKLSERTDIDANGANEPYQQTEACPQKESKLATALAWDKYRVMIADDAPLVVKMVSMLLTHKGHRVMERAVKS